VRVAITTGFREIVRRVTRARVGTGRHGHGAKVLSDLPIDTRAEVETFEQWRLEGVIQHTKLFRNVLTTIMADVTLAAPPVHIHDPSAAGRGCISRSEKGFSCPSAERVSCSP
jgi:hypothetical protein